jgi:hypothetical protein
MLAMRKLVVINKNDDLRIKVEVRRKAKDASATLKMHKMHLSKINICNLLPYKPTPLA